ncbi:hypothetical protein STCU_05577 [Strigomonas culicis]|nr:hypothetical protein STCU_05577 [Strigomonas culicis]|eukprot:EPY27761.1 hypothetical protein STCU_05577 [Strigomonas culicis]
MDRESSTKLRMDVKLIYTKLLRDVLLGEPKVVASLQRLSRRYKNLWKALLVFLDVLHTASVAAAAAPDAAATHRAHIQELASGFSYAAVKSDVVQEEEDLRILYRRGKESEAEVNWKVDYFRNRMGLLSALGVLRIEYIDEVISFEDDTEGKSDGESKPAGGGSTFHSPYGSAGGDAAVLAAQQQKATAAAREATFIQQHCYHVLTADLTEEAVALVVPQLIDFVTYMQRLLGSDGRNIANGLGLTMEAYMATAGFERAAGPTSPVRDFFAPPRILNYQRNLKGAASIRFKDVAQVIVLGVPLVLFSRYFKPHLKKFISGGVNAMPQPNSVVFSKIGVSKSTALRYLLGKDTPVGAAAAPPTAQAPVFCGAIEPGHALAFGDNPHSTDYELTVFTEIPFLSVEKDSQRRERHARIASRLRAAENRELRGVQPLREVDGTPAATFAELTARLQHSGPMMDDRLLSHLVHIGGEEEGSAIFLKVFMDLLGVRGFYASLERHRRLPAGVAAEQPVPLDKFQGAFGPAATLSRTAVHSGPLAKL